MVEYEKKVMRLPDWYKRWCLANNKGLSELPPEYLFSVMKARKNLLTILNNKIWFCLVDPEIVHKECVKLLGEST
jgi:hypothetical protein